MHGSTVLLWLMVLLVGVALLDGLTRDDPPPGWEGTPGHESHERGPDSDK